MPELPEVEYTARQLRKAITGAIISEALVFWERTIGHPDLPDFLAEIAGREIHSVRRRGKFLILDLSGDLILTIHRRMTGNLLLLPPGWEIDTGMQTTDPISWNIKGPTFLLKPIIGESHELPVGADLSCPPPMYRPSVANEHPGPPHVSHPTPAYQPSDLLYCRACFNLVGG